MYLQSNSPIMSTKVFSPVTGYGTHFSEYLLNRRRLPRANFQYNPI